MNRILDNYLGQEIGINLEGPLHIDAAILTAVNSAFISLRTARGYVHHIPHQSILEIIEHADGIEVGGLFEHKQRFNLVIKIKHVTAYTPV